MTLTLIGSLTLLALIAIFGRFFVRLPANIWILFVAHPLGMASSSMVVFAGGLLATKIAPEPELATLPLTLMIMGTATAVIPASMLMRRAGRRKGTAIGLSLAVIGALLGMSAAIQAEFSLLLIGAVFLGASLAFVAQMRFAAIESLDDIKDAPKAISVLMIGGMFAAIIGPEFAVAGKDWLDSPHGYAGSFLALAVMLCIAVVLMLTLRPIGFSETKADKPARPLSAIIRQPIFITAALASAVGYSVMSYVMTATPLSMHEIQGHSLETTKWVVQSHIIAMYLPSLFSAVLIRYIGIPRLMIVGSLTYVLVIGVALSGHMVMHYWWTMVLLGIGWNFLFTSGTLLLPQSYHDSERFKTQAVNDFSVFFAQAMASLSAGMILFSQGWSYLIYIAIPVVILILLVSGWNFLRTRRMVDSEVIQEH